MTDDKKTRIDVGFQGGQSLTLKVTEVEYDGLLAGIQKGDGWHKFTADESEVVINAGEVVYVRRELEDQRVGF